MVVELVEVMVGGGDGGCGNRRNMEMMLCTR